MGVKISRRLERRYADILTSDPCKRPIAYKCAIWCQFKPKCRLKSLNKSQKGKRKAMLYSIVYPKTWLEVQTCDFEGRIYFGFYVQHIIPSTPDAPHHPNHRWLLSMILWESFCLFSSLWKSFINRPVGQCVAVAAGRSCGNRNRTLMESISSAFCRYEWARQDKQYHCAPGSSLEK